MSIKQFHHRSIFHLSIIQVKLSKSTGVKQQHTYLVRKLSSISSAEGYVTAVPFLYKLFIRRTQNHFLKHNKRCLISLEAFCKGLFWTMQKSLLRMALDFMLKPLISTVHLPLTMLSEQISATLLQHC